MTACHFDSGYMLAVIDIYEAQVPRHEYYARSCPLFVYSVSEREEWF